MQFLVLATLLAIAVADETTKPVNKPPPKRTYVCPPDFIRAGNKCYYFSSKAVIWDDAHFNCNGMHSTLAVIRGKYQHKLLRSLLTNKYVAPLERWIDGRYDWAQHEWVWSASGKTIDYNGFATPPPSNTTEREAFQWRCIILDPKVQFNWDHRNCYEQKHYICQTKLRNLTRKQKTKLRKLYKNRKLNEVPVPEITNNALPSGSNWNETSKPNPNSESNDINKIASAKRPKPLRKRRGKKGKGRKKNKKNKHLQSYNGTLQDAPHVDTNNLAQNLEVTNKTAPKKLHWKTYYQGTASPYHPRGIVEEFDFQT